MKKITTALLSALVALSFSFFAAGCSEHKAMEPMGSKADTMHNEAPAMDTMKKDDSGMHGMQKSNSSMGTMQDNGMKKDMAPMEDKKM
jgi:pentapeptide MXKDX repeat protein